MHIHLCVYLYMTHIPCRRAKAAPHTPATIAAAAARAAAAAADRAYWPGTAAAAAACTSAAVFCSDAGLPRVRAEASSNDSTDPSSPAATAGCCGSVTRTSGGGRRCKHARVRPVHCGFLFCPLELGIAILK